MARKYDFKTGDGDTVLPVAGDPIYETDDIDLRFPIGNCTIVFVDGSGDFVTPTGGTIEFEASPIDGIWLDPPSEAVIDATTVVAAPDGVAGYTLPSFDGPVRKARMKLIGITGAVSAIAYHWRSDS